MLANNIGFVWSDILKNYSNLSSVTLLFGLVCYTLQIYFDFSGYSDMAIGLGKMLGFEFLENFNYPYLSKSLTEFWRRWHISLGNWFREYVYIPLGGNRKGIKRQIFNLSIVWLLTGIWHGANWNYIIWGIYYGALLIVEKLFLSKHIQKMPAILQHIYALFFILIGWSIFAIEDMSIWKSLMISILQCSINQDIIYYLSNYGMLMFICIISATPFIKNVQNSMISKSNKLNIVTDSLLYVIFFISVAMLVNSTYNPFLYFRF